MASVGGNRKVSSKLQKEHYKQYKLIGTRLKNKIKKLQRHINRFPNDKLSAENLEKIKKKGITDKPRPRISGSNRPFPRIPIVAYTEYICTRKTPGEQLGELLGITLPKRKTRKYKKTKVTHKPRKNVEKTKKIS